MAPAENKSGRTVVETRDVGVQPVVSRVAVLASSREPRFDMTRVGGGREILLMAGIARRRHDLELTGRTALVAGVAIDSGMGASQRESVVVLLHVLNRNLPATNCVALFAISSELALVNIGVAVLATFADIRKNHLHVAGSAGYGRVHTP